MASTFFGLSIATSGLYASQASMNTSAHNIANTQTAGYSRQETTLQAGTPISLTSSYGMVGTGVATVNVKQYRDAYYDTKYRNNNTISGNYSTKEYYFLGIENVISETNSDGLNATFDKFSAALTELQNDGGEAAKRNQVANLASGFTDFVNSMSVSLENLQKDCNEEIKTSVEQINSISQQIATLNKQINTIELTGQRANDLRDQRNLLLDSLSEYANISTSEVTAENGLSTTFEVRLDGQILVDNYTSYSLQVQAKDTINNQSDIDGLYSISWNNGQNFNQSSTTLGGKLKALFEVRDGNNLENFTGTANGSQGDTELTVTDSSCNDITKLNLPAENGVITIGAKEYSYDSFDVSIDTSGEYSYTFHLSTPLSSDVSDQQMQVGDSVDCKGIPYYMNQLTTLARTYAKAFNELHNSGQDLNGNSGVDFFTGKDVGSGLDFNLDESATSFSSKLSLDANGNVITANGMIDTSYYNITCKNFTVADSIMDDPNTIAVSENTTNGVDETKVLDKMIALISDKNLFKQGTPSNFIQKLTSDIGTDTDKASMFTTSQSNIVDAIDTQRMSISSVDQDEESMDLVKFQNAYNLNSKVIQTMNELYNVLINGLGI